MISKVSTDAVTRTFTTGWSVPSTSSAMAI